MAGEIIKVNDNKIVYTLSNSELAFEFIISPRVFQVQNMGLSTIYASLLPDIETRISSNPALDVSAILPGASVIVENRYIEDNGTIYLTGVGNVQVTATNIVTSLYTGSGGNGGGGSGSGEENVIEKIKVNGEALTVATDKSVNIDIPTKVSEMENDSGYLTAVPDTYATKTYVNEILADADNLTRTIVTALPADVEASENVIYMIMVNSATGEDKYEEYMKIDGTLQLIGDTSVDLTGYAKIGDIPDPYILPKATIKILGGVKVDGETITVDENGVIKCNCGGGSGGSSGDVQADFLTADGFGNLRYYNGHFQYYNGTEWIDTSATPDNVYIINMTPQAMKNIKGTYDLTLGRNKLKFEEPEDTVLDGQVVCVVESVVIRRKLGSAPVDENDGIFVNEIHRRDFGAHKVKYYVDETFKPTPGEQWYYKVFPMSTTGFYNVQDINSVAILCKEYEVYGFKINHENESDPASMITYLENCDNASYTPAYMDYSADTFNFGDWENAFFMQVKPCMLKYDGTVDYYLNPNDYSKREDGTDSDITKDTYEGNAMVGIPKVYWKIVNNGDHIANVYVCSKKLDDDFHCWSHIDANGNEIPYCYMPIYSGYSDGTRLRSLSDKTPLGDKTALEEIELASANNISGSNIWYTEVYSDRMLLNLLLLLIGKSTNTQNVFGAGNCNSYVSSSNTGIKATGDLNTKGLFWGSQDTKSCVKVFGIENWWGSQWRRVAGWVCNNGTQKIKMTYGQFDDSTVEGYNTTGDGYLTIENATPVGTHGGYISEMVFNKNGMLPKSAKASSTTYYTDGLWFNNSKLCYTLVGCGTESKFKAGAMCTALDTPNDYVFYDINASVSCKPLATT